MIKTYQVSTSTDNCIYVYRNISSFEGWAFFASGVIKIGVGNNVISKKWGGGIRFTGVDVPKNAVIDSAKLRLKSDYNYSHTTVNSYIHGEDSDNPATFLIDGEADYLARPRTAAVVAWDNISAWLTDTEYDSPDISQIVQEIIDRPGWNTGNAIVIFWDDHDGRSSLNAIRMGYGYEGNPAYAAQLIVEYHIPVPDRKYQIEVHNSGGDLLGILRDVIVPEHEEVLNAAGSLVFSLAADDVKLALIVPANELWLRDVGAGTVKGTYKLTRMEDIRSGSTTVRIETIGMLSQLGDELVEDYDTGAVGDTVTNIVTDLLALQVNATPLTVGTIEPTDTLAVRVTGDSMLSAILKIREAVGGYISVNESHELNWMNDAGEDKGQQIRYRKNLTGISQTMDYGTFGNRLYCYGAGEGDARIKLSDASGWSDDYVEDAASQALYGIIIRQFVDKSITHPDTLLAWANLKLAEIKDPVATYRLDMVELSEVSSGFSFDKLQLGSIVKVIDEELGIDVSARVVKIRRPDLYHPEDIEVKIANRTKDVTSLLGEIYNTQQLEQHIATEIGAGQVIVKGVFTVLDWVTSGQTTIKGSVIQTGTITATQLITTENLITKIIQVKDGIITNAKIASLAADKITAGNIVVTVAITTGALTAGGGKAVLDANGVTITGAKLTLEDLNGANDKVLFITTLGYLEIGDGVIGNNKFSACLPSSTGDKYLGTDAYTWGVSYIDTLLVGVIKPQDGSSEVLFGDSVSDYFNPYDNDKCLIGSTIKYWWKIIGNHLYFKDLTAFDIFDDLRLLKSIGTKKGKSSGGEDIDIIDLATLPAEVKLKPSAREIEDAAREGKIPEEFVNAGAMQGLAIGALKALISKVEKLEAEIVKLTGDKNG